MVELGGKAGHWTPEFLFALPLVCLSLKSRRDRAALEAKQGGELAQGSKGQWQLPMGRGCYWIFKGFAEVYWVDD